MIMRHGQNSNFHTETLGHTNLPCPGGKQQMLTMAHMQGSFKSGLASLKLSCTWCVCVWVWFFGCFPRGCSCYRQTETHHLWVPSWTSTSLSFCQGSTCGIPSRRRWRSTTTGSPEPVSRHRFPLLDYPHNDVNPGSRHVPEKGHSWV